MKAFRLVRCSSVGGSLPRSNPISSRLLSNSKPRHADPKDRSHPKTDDYREAQSKKALVPDMTNTTSTIANEMPSVGADKPPPEFITSVDPTFILKDSEPEITERMTGDTQKGAPESGPNSELGIGEMEGAKFKVEPLRRVGEDPATIRARLLCPSRVPNLAQVASS
jgi:hypothetical protein